MQLFIKNVKIYQDQWTAESTPFIKLEKGDLACMVDFRMNDESSINIQDKSDNINTVRSDGVITW